MHAFSVPLTFARSLTHTLSNITLTYTDSTEIFNLKQQMATMAQDWDPLENTIAFGTDQESNQVQTSNDYFLESASRVHFFAEPSALCKETGALLPQFQTDKLGALNKAGHGMHMIPGPFHDYATSDKISSVVLALLGWKDPVVPQSMYIFKQATVGGAVNSHQDSTFLYTTPRQSCLGLWLALDDSTLHNGCLWVRPKSHRETVRRVLKRNPDYFGEAAIQQSSNVAEGDTSQPKMVMETLQEDEQVPWEGLLPEGSDPPCDGLLQAGFIPVECKAGDLLCFPGQLDHLSLPNNSDAPRHTFQLHLVEGEAAGVTWSKNNWLQYPPGTPFLSIKKE